MFYLLFFKGIHLVSHPEGRIYIWIVTENAAENTWTRVTGSNTMIKKTA
jgi:hypothetical protein